MYFLLIVVAILLPFLISLTLVWGVFIHLKPEQTEATLSGLVSAELLFTVTLILLALLIGVIIVLQRAYMARKRKSE